MNNTDYETRLLDWSTLQFGHYNHHQIAEAIADPQWQRLRLSLVGMPLRYKYDLLTKFVHANDCVRTPRIHSNEDWNWRLKLRRVCVTNYVNALKRGGLVK